MKAPRVVLTERGLICEFCSLYNDGTSVVNDSFDGLVAHLRKHVLAEQS